MRLFASHGVSWRTTAVAAVVAMTAPLHARQEAAAVLARAAAYLDDYQARVVSVVMEEDYEQRSITQTGGGTVFRSADGIRIPAAQTSATEIRHLVSDVVMTGLGRARWITFRDVFSVDGRAVRDRDERLVQLFMHPSATTADQAGRIMAEGARFNLRPELNRTINAPFTALVFLLGANQPRSQFRVDRTTTENGVQTVVVRFTEQAMPRLIGSNDNAAASGAFWIEAGTGRVTRSELALTTTVRMAEGPRRTSARIVVTFGPQPNLDLWLPRSMEETYASDQASIVGTARYGKVRRFAVETGDQVAAPR